MEGGTDFPFLVHPRFLQGFVLVSVLFICVLLSLLVCPMLPFSLDCPFLIDISTVRTKCGVKFDTYLLISITGLIALLMY